MKLSNQRPGDGQVTMLVQSQDTGGQHPYSSEDERHRIFSDHGESPFKTSSQS